MELFDFFSSVQDPRRGQGQRYPLEAFLWMIFLSVACGHTSTRKIAAFCKANRTFFIDYFNLSHGVPSHVSFFKLLRDLDSSGFALAFNTFMASSVPLDNTDWVAGDGQTLRSTVVGASTSAQDSCAVVSLFCQKVGLTIAITHYLNKKEHEITVLLTLLLDNLRDKGVMLTLDALHCQKKQ